MAQGFKRTGSTFSLKKAASNGGNNKPTQMRKGARVIAPKRVVARTKATITAKLTASLNRRAESALITRIGHEESSLRLVKQDASVLEELLKKSKKKSAAAAVADKKKKMNEGGEEVTKSNKLMKSAIDRLGDLENEEGNDDGSDSEEVFTEDESIPMEQDEQEEK